MVVNNIKELIDLANVIYGNNASEESWIKAWQQRKVM